MSTSGPPGDYRAGQIVDGHVLAEDGQWYRIQASAPADGPAYDAVSGTFGGTLASVVRLAARALQSLNWTVTEVNDSVGLLVFETGVTWGSWSGATGSLTFTEAAPGRWRVAGTGKQNVRGGQTFAIDFGEADGKVDRVIERMAELADEADAG